MESMQIKTTAFALAMVVLTGNAATPAGLFQGNDDEIVITENHRDDTLEYTYNFPQAQSVETGNTFSKISIGNALYLTKTGEPTLPYVPLRLVIPEGKEIKSFDLSVTDEDTLSLLFPVVPGAAYVVPSEEFCDTVERDPSIYESEDFWPEDKSRFGGIHYKQGNGIGSYQLFPVQLSPLTNTAVAARTMTVRITWKQKRVKRSVNETPKILRRPLNSNELAVQYSYNSSSTRSTLSGSAEYLAITSKALKESSEEFNLHTLLAKHRERGLTTKILTVEEISGTYEGRDLQEKIRNAIIEHYNSEATRFVLLAGDTPIIPARQFFMNDAPHSDQKASDRRINISTDLYYSCLDGDHNFDQDTLWGETTDGVDGEFPDILSEVYIGRFPVETSSELANIVKKTLIHINSTTRKKVLLAGEHLGFGGISEYAKPSMEEVWQGGDPTGYFTRSFTSDPSIEKDTLYAEGYPSGSWGGGGRWMTSDLTEKLNTNEFGIINHLGHGKTYLNMRLHMNTSEYKPSTDLKNLLNNSEPIFVNSQACLSGRFEKETIAEYLTVGTPYGMWGGIWNSHWGLGQVKSTDSPSQYMQRQFWHAYFGHELKEVGVMNAYADEAAFEKSLYDWAFRWVSAVTHLFGDPAAPMKIQGNSPTIAIDPFEYSNWGIGHTFDINWYDNISENVTIELFQEGQLVFTISESIESNQRFSWNIPDEVPTGDNFTIRVSNADLSVMDESQPFSIDPISTLTLLTPQGGEEINKGETVTISWQDDLKESVSLYLYHGDEIHDTIASGLAPTVQSFNWTVPMTIHHGEGYFIRVVSDAKEWLAGKHNEGITLSTPTVTEYPFSLTFDELSPGREISNWAQVKSGNGDDFDWLVHSGATPSRLKADDWWNSTGPLSDANGDGSYIYCEASGNEDGKSAGILSPSFNIEGLKNGILSMKIHMYCKEDYGNMGKLNVYLFVDGEWDHIVHMNGSKGDKWIEKNIDLSKHVDAKEMFIYILANTGKSFASDIAIDDIILTGDKESVGLLSGKNSYLNRPGFALMPRVLTKDSHEMLMQLPDNYPAESVSYKLFDPVANMVFEGVARRNSGKTWKLPVPSSLRNGSYLLKIDAVGQSQETYKVMIGKQK